MKITEEIIDLIHAVLNSPRRAILLALLAGPKNISALLKEQKIKSVGRSTLCYHLNILENVGIAKSNYVILKAPHSKGRAGRVYEIDHAQLGKAIDAIEEYGKELSSSQLNNSETP